MYTRRNQLGPSLTYSTSTNFKFLSCKIGCTNSSVISMIVELNGHPPHFKHHYVYYELNLFFHLNASIQNPCRSRMGKGASHSLNRSEEHTSDLPSHFDIVCILLFEKE